MIAVPPTKQELLKEIPMFRRFGDLRPRPAFEDLYRILKFYALDDKELAFIKAEIDAREAALSVRETKYRDDE